MRNSTHALVQDDDSHWYVIPIDREEDWIEWLGSEDFQDGITPDFAYAIGGSPRTIKLHESGFSDGDVRIAW